VRSEYQTQKRADLVDLSNDLAVLVKRVLLKGANRKETTDKFPIRISVDGSIDGGKSLFWDEVPKAILDHRKPLKTNSHDRYRGYRGLKVN